MRFSNIWSPSLRAPSSERDVVAHSLSVAGSAPITDTKDDFTEWAARRFSRALPERFATVQPTDQHDFVTDVAGERVHFNLNVT
jgi:hypothetical protein